MTTFFFISRYYPLRGMSKDLNDYPSLIRKSDIHARAEKRSWPGAASRVKSAKTVEKKTWSVVFRVDIFHPNSKK